ncbi:MAG: membrane integrity-associated transporter subunit PqiC [Verrucomicrobiales bacterium]|nr:membrane integrity-associated transporter subunit PqiC [Verrucomicrobiales bacterium]
MNRPQRIRNLVLPGALALLVTGCLPKPHTLATRSYLLSPVSPARTPGTTAAPAQPTLGIGIVQMPSYLLKPSLAVRSGSNEVRYLEASLWAERLDTSFQRTLAANLASLLPTDQIRISSWSRDEVVRAVYVNVEQFDVDARGTGTLAAWWRITNPSGDKTLRSGEFRSTQPGPPPSEDPGAVASTLSTLTTRLSEQLAATLRESLAATP